jgi:DNA-binding transcriptional LysR family regulator
MGRAMLPHARAALAAAERARCAARQASGLEAGELRLATVYSVSLGVLPPALKAWRRTCPGVEITLFEHRHADELREAMRAGQADLAIGPPPPGWEGPILSLGHEEFLVVLPTDGAGEDDGTARVDLKTVADCGWVHYAAGNGLAEILDKACADAGFQPRAAVRTEQTATAPIRAAAGLGPVLVPANVIPPRFSGRVLRPNPPVRRTLAAYTRGIPTRSPPRSSRRLRPRPASCRPTSSGS